MGEANVRVRAKKVKPAVYEFVGRRGAASFGTFSRRLNSPPVPREQLVKWGWVDLRELTEMAHPVGPEHFLRFGILRERWRFHKLLYLAHVDSNGDANFFEWEGNEEWILNKLKESTSRIFVPAGWALALTRALEKEEQRERDACWA